MADRYIDPDEMARLAALFHDAALKFDSIELSLGEMKSTMESMYDGGANASVTKAFTELMAHYSLIEESHYQLEQYVYDTTENMNGMDVERATRIAPAGADS